MVAEVVHGTPYRFQDLARFSLAHGDKDRHPYPVPISDETIRVLKSTVKHARLGQTEEPAVFKRLDVRARPLKRTANDPSLVAFIAGEREHSPSRYGRSAFGWEKDVVRRGRAG